MVTKPPNSAPVPIFTKLGYGFGSVAYGIKDNGFAVFLLIYFNQVIGMPAEQVGLAILIALVADAFFDPVVGHFSDRTKSRWGRRHPWLYAAILPICVTWLILWNPPEISNGALFVFLVILAMAVRFSFSTYEVPTLAILPELTSDYDDRTEVFRYRFLFGWAAGLAMLYATYRIILVPTAEYENGLLNADGYHLYALVGAAVMFIALLISAISTHKRIAKPTHLTLRKDQQVHGFSDIMATFKFRPFVILLIAGVCVFANQGLAFALANYLLLFVWEFPQHIFELYPFALFGGVVMAFFLIPIVSRRFEKHKAAAAFAVLSSIVVSIPYMLRFAGLAPENGELSLYILVLAFVGIGTGFGICVMIMGSSIVADITDASEAKTGKRTEGLFFAGFFFMQKCVGGLGILVSALILSGIGFPDSAVPGSVSQVILDRLTFTFAATTVIIGLIGAFVFSRFPLGRLDHELRLAQLAVAAEAQTENTT
jgi:GPH family glycoside/pentoside/hexuronide:cation symporter